MRILIAPHEICGQMRLLAHTFRELGHEALALAYNQDPRAYPTDITFGWTKRTSRIKKLTDSVSTFIRHHNKYDVLHMFYGRSFLPKLVDLPLLKRLPCRLFTHFRGVEILSGDFIKYQRDRLLGLDALQPPLQRPHQAKRLKAWRKYADGLFVSEPDLLRIAPEARLVQQVIDTRQWAPVYTEPARKRPIRIIHPPSSRWKKGTKFVIEAIDALKRSGHAIDFVLVENMSHEKAKAAYASADIAVDQLLVGWHGNVSIEFMSLGKPVVCYIDPELHSYRPNLPIASATPANLASVLEDLILDDQRRIEMGINGRRYVEQTHDALAICEDLLKIYNDPTVCLEQSARLNA